MPTTQTNVVCLAERLVSIQEKEYPPEEEWADIIDNRDGWLVVEIGLLKGEKYYIEALEGGTLALRRIP